MPDLVVAIRQFPMASQTLLLFSGVRSADLILMMTMTRR